MEIYIVFRRGVYRHRCGGAYLHVASASAAALQMIRNERDDYHTYEVIKLMLDVVPPSDDCGPDEPRPVEEFSRVDREHVLYPDLDPEGITITRYDENGVVVSKTRTTITGE